MKAMCVHDIQDVSQGEIDKIIEKAKKTTNAKLEHLFYNSDKGEAFFEWEADSIDNIDMAHEDLGLGTCREMLPVTEVAVKP